MYSGIFHLPIEINHKIFDYITADFLNKDVSLVNKETKQLIDSKNLWLMRLKCLGISHFVLNDNFFLQLDIKLIKKIYFSVDKAKNRLNILRLNLKKLCLISGSEELIKLYDNTFPVDFNNNLLRETLYTSNLKTLQYLIKSNKLNVPKNMLIEAAAQNSTCDIVRYIVEEKNIFYCNQQAIHYAIKHNNIAVIRYLLNERKISFEEGINRDKSYYLSFMKELVFQNKIRPDAELVKELNLINNNREPLLSTDGSSQTYTVMKPI